MIPSAARRSVLPGQFSWQAGLRWAAGMITAPVDLAGAGTARLTVHFPNEVTPGDLHLILEVTDTGEPTLTSSRRLIVPLGEADAGGLGGARGEWTADGGLHYENEP